MWSISQRRALIALAALAVAALSIERYAHRVAVGFPEPPLGARTSELPLLDPNTATLAELSTLPGLGRVKAQAVVTYRLAFTNSYPGRLPFRNPLDLARVKGIGPATAKKLAQYLQFHP